MFKREDLQLEQLERKKAEQQSTSSFNDGSNKLKFFTIELGL